MQTTSDRVFEDVPAVRGDIHLLVGIVGASGSGKTFSALRLAAGMQRVTGGDIHVIDTESRRAAHYADRFKFRHVHFAPPFSPLDYLAAIEHCVARKASVIVIDSMSHEHEGPGGGLEWHERILDKRAGDNHARRERLNLGAWKEPKDARRRLVSYLTQINAHVICCFRAKEKIKIEKGMEPQQLGWMPIAGKELVFEMTVQFLLYPGSRGTPTWDSPEPGERATIKLPIEFQELFASSRPLDEDAGEAMARWAQGSREQAAQPATPQPDAQPANPPPPPAPPRKPRDPAAEKISESLVRDLVTEWESMCNAAADLEAIQRCSAELAEMRSILPPAEFGRLVAIGKAARARVEAARAQASEPEKEEQA